MSDRSTSIDERDLALPPDEPTVAEPSADLDANVQAPPSAARDAGIVRGGPSTGATEDDAAPTGGAVELEDDGMPPADILHEALKAVLDPEIGYNIVDLGLVYDVDKQDDGHVQVTMTLTTMGCPLTELLHQQVTMVLSAMPGVGSVDVEFTFSPPWSPEMMSDDVRDEMRAMGFNV